MKILTLTEHLENILDSGHDGDHRVKLQYITDGEPRSTGADLIAVHNGGVSLRSSRVIPKGKSVLLLVEDISERPTGEMQRNWQVQSIESKMIISKTTPDEEHTGKFVLSAEFVGNYRITGGEANR